MSYDKAVLEALLLREYNRLLTDEEKKVIAGLVALHPEAQRDRDGFHLLAYPTDHSQATALKAQVLKDSVARWQDTALYQFVTFPDTEKQGGLAFFGYVSRVIQGIARPIDYALIHQYIQKNEKAASLRAQWLEKWRPIMTKNNMTNEGL